MLLDAQSESIERSLWVAVRTLSEHAATLNRLAESADGDRSNLSDIYRARADEALEHSDAARQFLLSLHARLPDVAASATATTRASDDAANEHDVQERPAAVVPEGE